STITIPDNYQILTQAGVPDMSVKLDITGSTDPNLEAMLIYHFGQPDEVDVPLFNFDNLSPVGANGTNRIGFQDTVFTDASPTPIQTGSAPFFSTTGYRSEVPLQSAGFYFDSSGVKHTSPGLGGLDVNGNWTLVVKNDGTTGAVGALNSWSLTFQKPLPSTGLGEPVADQASTSFRIFTMAANNPQSSNT